MRWQQAQIHANGCDDLGDRWLPDPLGMADSCLHCHAGSLTHQRSASGQAATGAAQPCLNALHVVPACCSGRQLISSMRQRCTPGGNTHVPPCAELSTVYCRRCLDLGYRSCGYAVRVCGSGRAAPALQPGLWRERAQRCCGHCPVPHPGEASTVVEPQGFLC